jgi:hypothetical protein
LFPEPNSILADRGGQSFEKGAASRALAGHGVEPQLFGKCP